MTIAASPFFVFHWRKSHYSSARHGRRAHSRGRRMVEDSKRKRLQPLTLRFSCNVCWQDRGKAALCECEEAASETSLGGDEEGASAGSLVLPPFLKRRTTGKANHRCECETNPRRSWNLCGCVECAFFYGMKDPPVQSRHLGRYRTDELVHLLTSEPHNQYFC